MFQMTPLVQAKLSKLDHGFKANPIIIVISPLVSLMKDQVIFLRILSIRAGSIVDDKFVNIVYSSPSLYSEMATGETCYLTFDRNCCG